MICSPKLILCYEPAAVKNKIKEYFLAKQYEPVFIRYFDGEFDNQNQTIIDLKISEITSSWCVHEHIHCSVTKQKYVKNNVNLFQAVYYFPYKIPILFRERVYLFYPCLFSTTQKTIFQMEILQNNSKKNLLYDFSPVKTEGITFERHDYKKDLIRCTILWSVKSQKTIFQKENTIFMGELLNGGCSIFSFISFEFLHVKDNLLLSEYSLWVNDRGYTDRGVVRYGNPKKISYKMERLSTKNQLTCTIRRVGKKYK